MPTSCRPRTPVVSMLEGRRSDQPSLRIVPLLSGTDDISLVASGHIPP